MLHLLNLLAAIALLVWGTHNVRTGMLRVFGERLRSVLQASLRQRLAAVAAGFGVTSLVQSGTATCLILASFVGKGLVPAGAALAAMLGADLGSAAMAVVFSLDLSWWSPLLLFTGVVLFVSRQASAAGRVGRVLIGLGLITLALQLIAQATQPMMASPALRTLLAALPAELTLDIAVGAALTVLTYSSLAIVLLVAALAEQGLLPGSAALGFVIGANLGSALLALLATRAAPPAERRLPAGNLVFKLGGALVAAALLPLLQPLLAQAWPDAGTRVVAFHLVFNAALVLVFIGFTGPVGRLVEQLLPDAPPQRGDRPRHLDPSALATPSLAIACAAREALHQADLVETMVRGIVPVLRDNDLALAARLRRMDDAVDELYVAIKFYLTQISQESLSERESRRWTDIVSFTIEMEQIGDAVERALQDIEDRKIRKQRRLSAAGMAEICDLHERLLGNLRLAMSVFLDGDLDGAQRLLQEKARFRDLERHYAARHLGRLRENTASSVETSSLHLDLLSELKRINSHLCSVAYPILESAGALADTRIRPAAAAAAAEQPAR
ncbi:hypothetical protein CKO44_15165 [Rubrivivax gelatinosus]|uniref:PhoU domain-containing protein n=1 Tax=Rubrivivax gelatinosus TaxID=28068 RepID=A0ABS1DW68_RUBGE|nr:Na/Pi cotransporter family protein [Rubrivivax gelatinosus]MBK1614808.1 hypothetical protein [Rubrivivax gelatinosus]MBK1713599.1 hypothetical protein [Rubrivivax gelatinosus]